MKKVIAAVIILAIVIAAAWLILLRPSEYTDDSLISVFEQKKSSFVTMAEYLTQNNVNTTISGLLTHEDRYGVPVVSENRYRMFNEANTAIMRENIEKIVSDGSRVEFIFGDEGGLLSKKDPRIVYDPEITDDLSAKKLSEKDWYLYSN